MIEVKRLMLSEAISSEVARVSGSEDEAVEELVRQHSRLVYRIAYAALRSHPDAEDATQEVFLRVLRYRHKLAEAENRKLWLARIAWRVAVERSRRRRSTKEIRLEDSGKPIVEFPSMGALADEAMQSSQIIALLEQSIAVLPGKLREPLILSALEEMSPREVAVILGSSEAAVRSRVFRARQILREKLAERLQRKK